MKVNKSVNAFLMKFFLAVSICLYCVSISFSQTTGLNFPSNGDGNAFVAFQFLNPQTKGLPIWGPNNAGATYTWRIRLRQQTGYYVTMWWSNNGSFLWDAGSPNSYYGGHPYPQSGNLNGTSHWWEIGGDYGGDFTVTNSGSKKVVVKDVWYTQALRVTVNGNGTKTIIFYTALPSIAPEDIITLTVGAGYGSKNPPDPALTFGDSPWWYSYQHERLSGILRGIKVFNKSLSESDLITEAASDALVTNDGKANIWYMNINPTPNDISDKSGAGHHPAWADPANKATLWTETVTPISPEENGNTVQVYPNPSGKNVVINFSPDKVADIEVIDMLGKTVDIKKAVSGSCQLNVENYQSGLYLVKIISGNSVTVQKFIKE